MSIKGLAAEFVAVFAATLVTLAVAFLWSSIGHGECAVDWQTSFRFAIVLGILLTWTKSREIRK